MLLILTFILGLFLGRIRKKTLMREGKPYLVRITLLKCPWFSLKVHKALMSDPAMPHDHPWNYVSLILWGGYTEVQEIVDPEVQYKRFKDVWYGPGSLLFRRGDRLHKLVIPEGKYCVSLILTTKKWRDWGFYSFYNGWQSHKVKNPY